MNPAQPLFSAAPLLWGDTPETPVLGMPGRTRIILADDHPVVLMGAEMALCPPFSQDFAIVAQAQSAEELVEHLEQKPCDILITDYAMPYGEFPDGLALIGYTTTAIPFSITLNDCEADASNANIATATIQFEDASAAPVPPSVPGVFGLSPDSTAQGIGIQILKSDGTTPVELNTPVPLIPISASGTVLDFTARFYQTGPSRDVRPGIAKGALNFTLTYR